ncbi:hypothetical protein [Blastomonas sp. UPD001]|uniref:hypothetical protein n=1 Tax=Blastomonas sp. UPD001 TaxID=2217673 RepID=UPI0018E5A533|nr:hypothetical protein [Blastomonas sp. UPD001]MBL0965738.1 hypothetical protein [Blastomonas sp.]
MPGKVRELSRNAAMLARHRRPIMKPPADTLPPIDETRVPNDPAAEYDGPPDHRVIGHHAVFPETSHDQIERINFLAPMNRHLAARVVPGIRAAFEARVAPAFEARHGRPMADRHVALPALLDDTDDHGRKAAWHGIGAVA